MLFTSTVFLFRFLPITFAAYYLFFLPSLVDTRFAPILRRLSNLVLLAASLLFYAWGEKWLVGVMLGSTAIDFGCGLWIRGAGATNTFQRRAAVAVSLLSGLALLGVFKYAQFGLDNYNALVAWLGLSDLAWRETLAITLPLGISFYKFQSISYTIDVYRGDVEATRNPIDFFCYVTMFPQLVAGPIVRYRHVAEQLVARRVDFACFASGVQRFVIGLTKKLFVANVVAIPADAIFALPNDELTFGLSWLAVACYTLQIYFDFSAYSDMAIGLGRMLGFRFAENFEYPYVARSVQEFWRRWHISLSTWFRDYLYIPLGGNRRGPARTYANLVTVFFLCGLWHGASWTFVVWGLYHGEFLVLERAALGRLLPRIPRLAQHVYALVVAMGGWVFFRAETFPQAVAMFEAMAGLGAGSAADNPATDYLTNGCLLALATGAVFALPVVPWLSAWFDGLRARSAPTGRVAADAAQAITQLGVVGGLLLLCAGRMSEGAYDPFIYFRF